jgi:hypothetical protein
VKELLAPTFKRKLCKNSTGSEAHTVLLNVMLKGLLKNLECLEAMVGRFTPVADNTSCVVPLLTIHETHAARTLRETWVFPQVSIIGLHLFILIKTQVQRK